MEHYLPYLNWIDHQREHMKELVTLWANVNSHTQNLTGLEEQLKMIKKSFASLGGEIDELTLPSQLVVDEHGNKNSLFFGKALKITKRPQAPIKVLFAGHMDTVYPKHSPFQKVQEKEGRLVGPGVCDMKGGLIILLTALQAFEKSPYASKVGWEIIINPDEEIGSPGSRELFESAASRHHLGLIFEPAHTDGSLVTSRAGSKKLVLIVKGRAAHAGRDFTQGRSALFAAASLIVDLEKLSTLEAGQEESKQEETGEDFHDQVIINVGECHSGHGYNVVPDLAIVRINVRSGKQQLMDNAKKKIEELVKKHSARDGIWMELYEERTTPPKEFSKSSQKLFDWLKKCAGDLNTTLQGKPSRGVCDGNFLAYKGLATLDTLGAIGGNIHTTNEFVLIESLPARAKLTTLLLMRLGSGEFDIEKHTRPISL